ncbi:MAG: 2,3-bisphosphoglycerate-independent phosphoglycerate mutase [Amphritea sp.]
MPSNKKTIVLVILDGWGQSQSPEGNAIHAANTPVWDQLLESYPSASIGTSGEAVGLPDGQMGNSEVGHMNIGAGRTVYQNFSRINKAISDGSFNDNSTLIKAVDQAVQKGKAVHILGMLSAGGVHSHVEHIQAMCTLAVDRGATAVYVHAFLDGRDTLPRSALEPIKSLEATLQKLGNCRIATVTGRYYAMDRDQRWERTEKAYRLIALAEGEFTAPSASAALEAAYARNESDEFVQGTIIWPAGETPVAPKEEDTFIFMNFRPDRARQLTRSFVDTDFSAFNRPYKAAAGNFVTLTQYAESIDTPCAFPPVPIENCLGEFLAKQHKQQLRIAETEKYAHVTFFFNCGQEPPFEGENRLLVPSPKVPSYDMKPEMSAHEVTENLVDAIRSNQYDLIICNYANGDMVGHTGNFQAAIKAVETLDHCLDQVVSAILEEGGECLITADHGNVEQMLDPESGQPLTAHTTGPVPLIHVSGDISTTLTDGSLCDIAPTIVERMALTLPEEMTGKSLIKAG